MAFASDGMAIDDVEDGCAHEGMLLSAKYIHRCLMGYQGQDQGSQQQPLLDLAQEQLRGQVGAHRAQVGGQRGERREGIGKTGAALIFSGPCQFGLAIFLSHL